MQKEQLAGMIGHFYFSFGKEFFIETNNGNFVWNNPDYGDGDNTVKPFKGTLKQWIKSCNIPYCRDKGSKLIGNYIGNDFAIVS